MFAMSFSYQTYLMDLVMEAEALDEVGRASCTKKIADHRVIAHFGLVSSRRANLCYHVRSRICLARSDTGVRCACLVQGSPAR